MLSDHSGALTAAFEFTTKVVGDVTIGLPDLVTLPDDASPADVQQAVTQRGFSRYVLVDESGEPTGYVHIKDVLDEADLDSDYPVAPRKIRSLVTLRDSIDLEDALATLRQTGAHVA
jgi:CBS domain containing-hemolysin-like protein